MLWNDWCEIVQNQLLKSLELIQQVIMKQSNLKLTMGPFYSQNWKDFSFSDSQINTALSAKTSAAFSDTHVTKQLHIHHLVIAIFHFESTRNL